MDRINNVKIYPACITFDPIAFIPRYCLPECQLTPTDWTNHDYYSNGYELVWLLITVF